jgi:hypothetical protein
VSRDVHVGVCHCFDDKVGCICSTVIAGAQISNAEERSEKLKLKAEIPFTKYRLYTNILIYLMLY